MINFILCDDHPEYIIKLKKIITKKLMGIDLDYRIHSFDDVNSKLANTINCNLCNKIYILDVELPSGSGLDFARKIREAGDWDSIIIINTVHYELSHAAYKKRLMILDFISKYNNSDQSLEDSIDSVLSIVNKRQVVSFSSDKIIYRLSLNEIIFVERDSYSRKLTIKTTHNDYQTNCSFSEFTSKLGHLFIKVNRSMVINSIFIKDIDFKNNIITLNDLQITGSISNAQKKELKKLVDY